MMKSSLLFTRRVAHMTTRPAMRWTACRPAWLSTMRTVVRPNSSEKIITAVEAPDGTPDALMYAELHHVSDLIDHAAKFEDVQAVRKWHAQQEEARKIFAVEAPDGTSDALADAELHQVKAILQDAVAKHQKKS